MSSRWNTIHAIFLLYLVFDLYTYHGLQSLVSRKYLRWFQLLYGASSLFFYYCFYRFYHILSSGSIFSDSSGTIFLGIFLSILVGKMCFSILMFAQDFSRIFWGLIGGLRSLFDPSATTGFSIPSRRKFMTTAATGLAGLPFFTMLYGITIGKYRYTINPIKVSFPDLPPAFEGFKIIQISDIHAGSFDNPAQVAKGVAMINEQNPDLIVFTGDMVNSDKNEVDPYIDIFGKLKARHGQLATLGNHDYYGEPDHGQALKDYWQDFHAKYRAMGFDLLNNTHRTIEKEGERLQILGVENWGKGPYFPKKGDLDKALTGVGADDFCILLSHDPTHWSAKVLPHQRRIPLTLSGHTHGFQFGINIPGFKWSPAQYRYPHWLGLYEEAEQKLYVNRGFGYLGFPGRVGMWPEITVIELAKA